MRSRPTSHTIFTLIAAPVALLVLVGCVDSAEPDTTDTIAPLPTVTTLGGISTTPTVLIGGSSATSPTTIPIATSPTATAPGGTETAATEPVDTTPVVGKATYKVVANDTLFGIAKKCSITATALAEYNKWSDGVKHSIFPGDSVALPCVPAADTATTVAGATTTTSAGSSSAATSTTFDPASGGTYTVVEGDYLAGIAAKTGTTVAAIVQANGWEDENHVIIPGQKIKLPAKP